jgi:hypothetical protein
MSHIGVTIDRLVLHGLDRVDSSALANTLRTQLSQVLGDCTTRAEWAHSHRTPVLKLGRMALEAGPTGVRKLGAGMARAIGKGLKA